MEIPGGWGESREALWNGKSSGVGGQTGKKPSVGGGVWVFSGTTQFNNIIYVKSVYRKMHFIYKWLKFYLQFNVIKNTVSVFFFFSVFSYVIIN